MARKKGVSKSAQGNRPQRKKGRKRGGLSKVLLIALLTLVAGAIILSVYGPRISAWLSKISPERVTGPPIKPPPARESRDIKVYFSGSDGSYLKAETRAIERGGIESEAAEAINALIRGPGDKALEGTLPPGARLLSLKLRGSTAYADFSPELVERHPGGSSGELHTVYSIVNTLALNFPAIKEVQILVEGKAVQTIAGHIDVTEPLSPDMALIRD